MLWNTCARNSFVERRLAPLLLALLMVQFGWRAYRTHRIFNDTADEQVHIDCGLEVWERRQYALEAQHPPLARVVLAALPHLVGGNERTLGVWWEGDDEALYWRTLSLARLGNLFFLPVLLLYVYRWGRQLQGARAGLGAAALVAFSPNLLAHASLATLDFGAATTLFVATYYLWRWSCSPQGWGSALAATGSGVLAVLTKFTALFLLPLLGVVFFAMARAFPGWRRLALCLGMATLAFWAGYGFSVGPLPPPDHKAPRRAVLYYALQKGVERVARTASVPAPMFVRGVLDVVGHNAQGHQCYLLGKVGQRGWWYYFPVALAVKSTLPLLALVALGLILGPWARFPAAAAALVLGVAMSSNLNMGVRHILVIYPLFALLACGLFAQRRRGIAAAALLLLGWHAADSLAAHPDYLAYFNQIARGREEYFLLDSNLDWGQDLERLRRYLRENHVNSVYLSFFGRGDFLRRRMPEAKPLPRDVRPSGWVAVSQAHLVGMALPGYNLGWLKAYPPRARIGKSILVYYFPEPAL